MKIASVQLIGFGKLVDRSFEFGPNLNLVFGLNEVGKSTLQQALLVLLFGFFEEGRITTFKRATQDSYRPWDGKASYEGSLIYSLDNGKRFKITRKFLPEAETSVYDLQKGKDISSEFPSADRGRLFVADEQLGINKSVFENTCFIRQAELVALDSSAATITETLMSLSAAGSGNTTTVEALSNLEMVIRDEIGSERAYTRPLAQAINLLKKLEEERAQILQKRREVYSHFRELNQCGDRLGELDAQRNQILYLQSLADFEETKSKIESIDAMESEIATLVNELEALKNWAEFPSGLRDEILRLSANRNQHKTNCQKRERLAIEALEKLQIIEKTIIAHEEYIKDYEDARQVNGDELSSIRDLKNKVEIAANNVQQCQVRINTITEDLNNERQRVDIDSSLLDQGITITQLVEMEQKLISTRERVDRAKGNYDKAYSEWNQVGMSYEKYRELETFVQEVNSGVRPVPKPRKGCRSILGGIVGKNGQKADQTPTESIIYGQIKPIYLQYYQAKEEYDTSYTSLTKLEASIKEFLGEQVGDTVEPSNFHLIRIELEKALDLQAAVKQQQKTLASLQDELHQANERYSQVEGALVKKLADLGIDTTNLLSAIQYYEDQCERKFKLEKLDAELTNLIAQADNCKSVISSYETAKKELELTEEEIRNTLLQAGIITREDSIETAISDFEVGVKNNQRWEKSRANYEHALKRREMLLDGLNLDNIQKTINELCTRIEKYRLAHPKYQDLRVEKSYREYEAELEQIANKREELLKDQLRLEDTIQRISNNLRSLAEIDEQINNVKIKINSLEIFKAELELAIDLLKNATQEFQRQFAPRIELLMGGGISHITKNRYYSIKINPGNLNVSLVAPEIGKEVGVERLSTGTRDLVYLMLRLAIAQYMSRTGEKLPLLLDDPLVQFDKLRLENALEYLQQISQGTQVILFTKDENTKKWIENHVGDSDNLIELT